MVKPLFDTNILIDYLNGIEAARGELALYESGAISIITWMEVLAGVRDAVALETRAFLERFEIIGVERPVAEKAILLRRDRKLRLPDAIVWASAIVYGRLLVTRDEKGFPGADPGIRIPYRL